MDLRTWVELLGFVLMVGALMNQVRVMNGVIRDHARRLNALEAQSVILAEINIGLKFITQEVDRLRHRLDRLLDRGQRHHGAEESEA